MPFNQQKILTPIYGFAALATMVAPMMGWTTVNMIFKPLLMPLLMLFVFLNKGHLEKRHFYLLMLALFFSWWGDNFLIFQKSDPIYFLLGLSSFLLAHVFYVFVFAKGLNWRDGFVAKNPGWLLLFLVYEIGFLYLLSGGLGEMFLPVCVYASFISLMGISALNRKGLVSSEAFNLVFCGAMIFIVSDSTIAINKFYQPFGVAKVIIMFTYCFAQYLIVMGILKQGK